MDSALASKSEPIDMGDFTSDSAMMIAYERALESDRGAEALFTDPYAKTLVSNNMLFTFCLSTIVCNTLEPSRYAGSGEGRESVHGLRGVRHALRFPRLARLPQDVDGGQDQVHRRPHQASGKVHFQIISMLQNCLRNPHWIKEFPVKKYICDPGCRPRQSAGTASGQPRGGNGHPDVPHGVLPRVREGI